MDTYHRDLKEEKAYLEKVLLFIRKVLEKERSILAERRGELLEGRREMWKNTVHFSTDFERLTEISQYLSILESHEVSYANLAKQIEKYNRMLDNPYFGRFDFIEEGSVENEKIYVGVHSLIDTDSYDMLVYDWRAPICKIYYQYELGEASYSSPKGQVGGRVTLKRQYKLLKGQLLHFFDCSINIRDEILQEVLSNYASPRMKSIVETIQREQDAIIRDTQNELLMVQGVAGSGKTSVALHRIAYLLYHGMNHYLTSQNILILSPNKIFSQYISSVLPELGEENIQQLTFDSLIDKMIGDRIITEKKQKQLEAILSVDELERAKFRKNCVDFKESDKFFQILERFLQYYERQSIGFQDIYYDGKIIETKEGLKNIFLNNKIGRPIAKRLKRIEGILLNKVHPLRKERIKKIEKLVQKMDGHELEIKSFSRLLSMKESNILMKKIRQFTDIDYFNVYCSLFKNMKLFLKMSQGIALPDNIEEIIEETKKRLDEGWVSYEDSSPILFLKLRIEGNDNFSEIKQIVIDEGQDYSYMQYQIFKILFPKGSFTVLGDIHQTIGKTLGDSFYEEIVHIFNKKSWAKVFLDKSYRSSYEISRFSKQILDLDQTCVSFERMEEKPKIEAYESIEDMDRGVIDGLKVLLGKGYISIAIVCKTYKECEDVYKRLKSFLKINLITSETDELESGIVIVSSYMAKGLEFDAVLVYNVSSENYTNEIDKKLLYIACTRALHRLILTYVGEKSTLIPVE